MTIKTIAAITFGNALGGVVLSAYFTWKARRSEIRMVRNRNGEYVDATEIWEKRALAGLAIFSVLIVLCGVVLLS